jgi:hypothetical protein
LQESSLALEDEIEEADEPMEKKTLPPELKEQIVKSVNNYFERQLESLKKNVVA